MKTISFSGARKRSTTCSAGSARRNLAKRAESGSHHVPARLELFAGEHLLGREGRGPLHRHAAREIPDTLQIGMASSRARRPVFLGRPLGRGRHTGNSQEEQHSQRSLHRVLRHLLRQVAEDGSTGSRCIDARPDRILWVGCRSLRPYRGVEARLARIVFAIASITMSWPALFT